MKEGRACASGAKSWLILSPRPRTSRAALGWTLVTDTFSSAQRSERRDQQNIPDPAQIGVESSYTLGVSLTPKEHDVAMALRDRFFLFVVKNFQEAPFHEIFQNPLSSGLQFRRTERVTVQVSWLASV